MTIKPEPQGLLKLSGTIANYKATRAEASFVFTDTDRNTLGVVAIAAGMAGLSGPAIATASYAASTEEFADYVEFELDGKSIKGWVWRSPFKEGDAVDVAAEWRGGHYEMAGISRPADRTIALYPHCSRGRVRHIKNAVKWWFVCTSIFVGSMLIAMAMMFGSFEEIWLGIKEDGIGYVYVGIYAFFGLMTISLARKWMPFVRLTEKICRTLDIPDAGNVDLVKSSKAQRRPNDPGEFGTFYFRY